MSVARRAQQTRRSLEELNIKLAVRTPSDHLVHGKRKLSEAGEEDNEVVNPDLALLNSTGDPYCDKLIARINSDSTLKYVESEYTLKEKLGEGSFAKVYKAIHKETLKEIAIKVVSLEDTEAEKERARNTNIIGSAQAVAKRQEKERIKRLQRRVRVLDNEIVVLKKIAKMPAKARRSLVTISGVMATKNKIVLAMELLSGGELFDRVLQKERYSERDAAFIMRRIMKGVKVLHSAGIIHRDLKPENLVFETQAENSLIKITDFGLAFFENGNDLFHKATVGSPGYIAPEIIVSKTYTPACDIWSMGCILFILLVGGPPFGGANQQELFDSIKTGMYNYPSDSNVSSTAKDLIAKMLTVDPRLRITAAQVLKHPWLTKKAATADLMNTFNNLRAFNTRKKLKEMAVAMVYSTKSGKAKLLKECLLGTSKEDGFSGEELINIRDYLRDACDEKKMLSFPKFKEVMVGLKMDDLPLERIFDLFKRKDKPVKVVNDSSNKGSQEEAEDASNSNLCSVADICVGLSTAARAWNGATALKYCFDIYDKEGQGEIDKEDVQRILRVILGEDRFDKLAAGMRSIFNTLFKKSEKVSFNDFKNKLLRQGFDWNLKENVTKVKNMVKRATMVGYSRATRLSSNLTLATIKSSFSMTIRQSFDDNASTYSRKNSTGRLSAKKKNGQNASGVLSILHSSKPSRKPSPSRISRGKKKGFRTRSAEFNKTKSKDQGRSHGVSMNGASASGSFKDYADFEEDKQSNSDVSSLDTRDEEEFPGEKDDEYTFFGQNSIEEKNQDELIDVKDLKRKEALAQKLKKDAKDSSLKITASEFKILIDEDEAVKSKTFSPQRAKSKKKLRPSSRQRHLSQSSTHSNKTNEELDVNDVMQFLKNKNKLRASSSMDAGRVKIPVPSNTNEKDETINREEQAETEFDIEIEADTQKAKKRSGRSQGSSHLLHNTSPQKTLKNRYHKKGRQMNTKSNIVEKKPPPKMQITDGNRKPSNWGLDQFNVDKEI